MATYLGTHGSRIQTYTTNPDNPNEGEVWYNATDNVLKFQITNVTSAGSWRTGANLNDGRNAGGSAGTRDAALFFAGDPASAGTTDNTELYDGTSWTEVNNLNQSKREVFTGLGLTNTAALCVGGSVPGPTANVESWNGTNWTEVNNLNAGRTGGGGAGSPSSALAFGGGGPVANTELWNGTNWTEVNNLNTARSDFPGGSGTDNTSAICAGGYTTANVANVETWNGTNWTEVNDLNVAKRGLGSARQTSTSSIVFGGYATTSLATAESWNGTNWTEENDLSATRNQIGGAGSSSTNAIAFGGDTSTSTEEWTGAGVAIGAWSTGGSLNQGRYGIASSGTVTASIAFGGRISPPNVIQDLTESYDGTSWTEVNDLNSGRGFMGSTTGPYTAVLGFGGSPPTAVLNEQWNGTNWTEITDLNNAKSNVAGCGSTTAALATGGSANTNELWNGSNWTEVNDLNTARNGIGPNSSGTSTATLVAGGEQPASPYALYANSELWNGTNWTEVNDLNTARHQLGHTGTSTNALAFGGALSPTTDKTEDWNGVSWQETADMNTSRGYPASSGTAAAALAVGGTIPPGASTNATEEWSLPSVSTRTIDTD